MGRINVIICVKEREETLIMLVFYSSAARFVLTIALTMLFSSSRRASTAARCIALCVGVCRSLTAKNYSRVYPCIIITAI